MPDEQAAPQTLAEELGSLIDAGSKDEVSVSVATDTGVTETQEQADQRARDEKGRFVAQEKAAEPAEVETKPAAPVEPAAPAQTEAPAEAPQVDAPPSTWTPAAKAEWATLSPVVKQELKKRESDFQKGIGQYKQAAEVGTKFMAELQPYEPMIRAANASPEQVLRGLLAAEYALRTGSPQDKAQMVLRIAQQYGADMSPYFGQPPQGEAQTGVDPRQIQALVSQALQPYAQQFQQTQAQLSAQEQQRQQAERQQALNQIEQFRNAADEKGQPKHAYFDNVSGLMSSLLQSGQAANLDQAYEMACRAHPEVWQALTVEQRRKAESTQLEQARKKTEEAKRLAAANLSGQGGVGLADVSKISLADELRARMEGASI